MQRITKSEIDAVVSYVANQFATCEGQWFSVKGGHGWSEYDCISDVYFNVSAFDWAVKLGFMDSSMTPGSCGYTVYRLTKLGKKHAEKLDLKVLFTLNGD